ncbi:MAG: VCBS repeat-containing protein [Bacteroidota bacterium]|nr:VCBS repeat-containing protein [Bacteroidota bacterium]
MDRSYGLYRLAVGCVMVMLLSSCQRDEPLFALMSPGRTGVDFNNAIIEQQSFNVLDYEYFYNGAGVAAGDINNDGLPDLFFTANLGPDRLYLNLGDWQFQDITERAGIVNPPTWTTGVTMVDVNGDGWIDIYVCRSGKVSAERRRNVLYINNGDLTFTEQAAAYGLDDAAYSNHGNFFDYDRDGDLDLYLLNHSIRRYTRFDVEYMRAQRDSLAGDKLFRNDGGYFTDISDSAGIIGNPLGFGLSAVASDIDQDGWPDIYVSNDYIEDDYLYINQRDGTFAESIRAYLTHTSYSSMGADIADINHDLHLDIVTLDMLAEDNYRQKILKGPEDHVFYEQFRKDGFHEQYMRNMLHVWHEGDYMEVGQLAGVSNTDWSWAALFADFDLDSHPDLLVTNGYLRDYTNLDFLRATLPNAYQEASSRGETLSTLDMVQHMPTTRIPNYIFQGGGHLIFTDRTEAWGLDKPTHSNGAVWADLDGDLDLDLIISNINEPAFLYRNQVEESGSALKVILRGGSGNTGGIGARVTLRGDGFQAMQELQPVRGYLSSVEPVLVFGTPQLERVDVEVRWPDGSVQILTDVPTGQVLTLRHDDGSVGESADHQLSHTSGLFRRVARSGLDYIHREDLFSDFDIQPLMPQLLSREGPALAAGDVNRDGLLDVFAGGAHNQPGGLYLQQAGGTFVAAGIPEIAADSLYEDVDAAFADFNGDGAVDLYVVSGGASYEPDQPIYQDRLYLNMGFGQFAASSDWLPALRTSGSVVAPNDFDSDGDVDLFVGGRLVPTQYPAAPRSYLLVNTGEGFVDATALMAPDLMEAGMVTAAVWADVHASVGDELIIAGEWMPVRAFAANAQGIFREVSSSLGLEHTSGFWNVVVAADIDLDGDTDLIAGNRGTNSLIRVSPESPASLYAGDLDRSGTWDLVMGSYLKGFDAPLASRDQMIEQMPSLATRFDTYESYAHATTYDLVMGTPDLNLMAVMGESMVFMRQEDGTFMGQPLPLAAQVAPVRSILVRDVSADDQPDLILAGNQYGNRAEEGRLHAGRGVILEGRGNGIFEVMRSAGFSAKGDVRHLLPVSVADEEWIVVGRNNSFLDVYTRTAQR